MCQWVAGHKQQQEQQQQQQRKHAYDACYLVSRYIDAICVSCVVWDHSHCCFRLVTCLSPLMTPEKLNPDAIIGSKTGPPFSGCDPKTFILFGSRNRVIRDTGRA